MGQDGKVDLVIDDDVWIQGTEGERQFLLLIENVPAMLLK